MTEIDRLLLRALNEYEIGLCECGHHRSESMSQDHDPDDPENSFIYRAGAPIRCQACTVVSRAERARARQLGDEGQHLMDGLKFGAELVQRWVPPQSQ